MARQLTLLAALSFIPAIAFALPPVATPAPPSPACRAFVGQPGPVRLAWSDVRATSSCFFFSGPEQLGRDDHLGVSGRWNVQGERSTLDIGGLEFSGTMRGRNVALQRVSTHDYGGAWQVTERINGAIRTDECGRLVAHYHYDECSAANCAAPGTCHIDATLTITPR